MSNNHCAAYVRHYNPSTDLKNVIYVFRETADDSLKVEPVWTVGSFIWCRPYLQLSPSTCFVVDDGRGRAVGYILGTPNTAEFCEDWLAEYVSTIHEEIGSLPLIDSKSEDHMRQLAKRRDNLVSLIRSDPRKLMYGSYAEQLRSYPGHLHIDILPSHQRRGFGRKLVDAWKYAAKGEGCTGAYLGMVASNDDARRFYDAIGFERLPQVLDQGLSGELGRTPKRADGGEEIYYVVEL